MKAVREFYNKFNIPVAQGFKDEPRRELRKALLEEEYHEYLEAESKNDIVGIADALADMIYIICGTALEYNIPLAEVFDEVQRSNMTKNPSKNREDGKILKGPDYEPPQIRDVLRLHGTLS